MASVDDGRIDTWAAIGAHIGRDARTAQRYHRERGLPVHRVSGVKGSTVYALKPELDAWLDRSRSPSPLAEAPGGPAPVLEPKSAEIADRQRPRSTTILSAILIVGVALAIVGAMLAWSHASRSVPREADAEAQRLYQEGAYACSRRTGASLMTAIDRFTQVIVRDPNFTAAYVGLAEAYNLAPELAGMAPEQAYPRAKAAAMRALALDPRSAAAHRVLGFVDFWWEHDVTAGYREFETAIALEPQAAQTHHWFATALAARADPRALPQIDQAVREASSTASVADRGYVLMMLRRYGDAKRVLDQVLALDRDYGPAHDYQGDLAERFGDIDLMIREHRRAAELRNDPKLSALMGHALDISQKHGPKAAVTMLSQSGRRSSASQPELWSAAVASALLHDRPATLSYLRRLRAIHDPAIMTIGADPTFDWLHLDPEFLALQPQP